MKKEMKENLRVLVTGGAGFIGSNLVDYLLAETGWQILVLDKLSYAANPLSLQAALAEPRCRLEQIDLADQAALGPVLRDFQPHKILHLAAESHVDRSIDGPRAFLESNICGSFNLLEAARELQAARPERERRDFRLLHVSTDEVFGSLGPEGYFTEDSAYDPRSPYAASKAASDHLARAWFHTYGLPVLVTNCSNNYGPRQFPEKLIPLVILRALAGESIPVYGRGQNVRDWLYVGDHAAALLAVLRAGRPGSTYNVGGRNELSNLELVNMICGLLDQLRPRPGGAKYAGLITFVPDRPGHDQRYAIDPARIETELGWRPATAFARGLRRTVQWYLDNQAWCAAALDGKYQLERLGGQKA